MKGSVQFPIHASPGGVREDIAIQGLPDGVLDASSNYLPSLGVGTVRPGYLKHGTLTSADRIIGIGIRGDAHNGDNIVLHSLTTAEHWDGSTQAVITGTWAPSTADQLVRMVTYESGGTTYLLRMNAANAIDKWDGTASAFADATGAPAGIDMTVVGGYVIVAKVGRDIVWNKQRDIDTWSSTDRVPLLDSPGTNVAIRKFGPTSFAVYKTDLVYLGTLEPSEVAFSFKVFKDSGNIIGDVSGPVSPAAVFELGGWHYWLGYDNAIRRFNGREIQVVDRGMQRTIQRGINIGNRGRVHSMPRTTNQDEGWWWYPDATTGDVTKAASLVSTVQTESGQVVTAMNNHTFNDQITASSPWKSSSSLDIAGLDIFSSDIAGLDSVWPDIASMVGEEETVSLLGDVDGNFYQFGQALSDNGTAISWSASHGYRAPAGLGARLHLGTITLFWKKTVDPCFVTVQVTPSDSAAGGEESFSKTVDLSQPIKGDNEVSFPGARGMFYHIKVSGTKAVQDLEYRGGLITGWPLKMV